MSTPTLTDIDVDVTISEEPGRTPARSRGRRWRRAPRRTWRSNWFAYALVAPAVFFMVLVHVLPAAGGILLSFKNLNTFTFAQLYGAPWAGLENYRAILFDGANPLHSGFLAAAQNTAVYTFWTVGLTLCGGMAIALLVKRPMRGQKVVRALMLTPWIVPSYVVATLWQFMWQSDVGIVNKVLVDYTHLLHHRPVWLLGPKTMWAIIIPSVWRGLPFAMLIFVAGLQVLPPELYDAAAIDGAGPLRRSRSITPAPLRRLRSIPLPLMRPLIAIQLLFGVIYAAYQFAIPYVMLGTNPGDDADLMMTLIVRQSFSN